MKIAYLGLGVMGSGMAHRLIEGGFDVTVWNRSPEKGQGHVDAGGRLALSPRDAVTGADVVIASLADDMASRDIWSDAIGGLKPGTLAIETSTLSPAWIREWARSVTDVGGIPLDAPVTGSKASAESGHLLFIVGGDADGIERARLVFGAMGRGVIHIGGTGAGALFKLINNFLCGVQLVSLAEALTMIDRSDLDRGQALDLLMNGAPGSPLVNLVGRRMADGDASVNFMLQLMGKDLSYASTEAQSVAIDLKTAEGARARIQAAVDAGFGQQDISYIYNWLKA